MRAWIRDVPAALAAVLVAVSPCPAATGDSPPSAGHYPLKAELLFNFARFVQWPEEAFPAKNTPLRICVLGDDPFGSDLEADPKRTINRRAVVVLRAASEDALTGCHVVFISASEAPRLGRALSRFGTGVLTVSDMPGFAERGGIVGFIMERDRVRFEINAETAHAAGLKISSKLLKLAKVIR